MWKRWLSSLVTFGVRGSFKNSENRVTLFTNAMNIWGLISLPLFISFLESNSIGSDVYGTVYLTIFLLILFSLYSTLRSHFWVARVATLAVINLCAWEAAILFGTTFNGYMLFFIAILYAVITFASLSWPIRILTFAVSFVGLPAVDILSFNKKIPITGLNSSEFEVSLLLVDTLVISGLVAILMFVEKHYSLQYERDLVDLNNNLESLVKERTKALLKSKEENMETALVKAQFLANISHELRIPIQAILGFSELIQRRIQKAFLQKPEDVQKTLHSIQNNSEKLSEASTRMQKLLETLLEITREGGGELQARPAQYKLKEIVHEAVEQSRRMNPDPIKINIKGDLELDMVTDKSLLQQSLVVLIDNAIKFSNKDSAIEIEVARVENCMELRVQNRGFGIDPLDEERIFDAFFQGTRTDQKTGGTGLGLTLCRKYMGLLSGQVYLKDSSQQNTIFVLRFPLELSKKCELPLKSTATH